MSPRADMNSRTWYPEGLEQIRGKSTSKPNRQQHLSDKTVADICESLIGAALMSKFTSASANTRQFDQAVKAVTTFVMDPNHDMVVWNDYFKALQLPKQIRTGQTSVAQNHLAEQVSAIHDYHFQNPLLLVSAFQHPSYPSAWSKLPSYQRLEFLGDAVLDFACAMHLYHLNKTNDEQWLTEHKMAMVSNRFLAALCVKIGFHKHLLHNDAVITSQVQNFVQLLASAESKANGSWDYWVDLTTAPKVS